MYQPKHFEENNRDSVNGLIKAFPFATFITHDGKELVVNHVPMLLDPTAGEFGTLRCHVARANPLWKTLASGVPAVAVFQGPYAYISPSWYVSKRETGKAVPTWNYVVVHAHGTPRVVDDADWLLAHVTEMSSLHEASQRQPWKVSDSPPDFIASMVKAIVGIEMPIARLEGKWKLSQNRIPADREAIIAELGSREDDASQAMAAWVKQANQV
jgi:transcriptional regulator